jgi:hypothetical protein
MSPFSYLLLLKCGRGCSAHADNRGPSRGRSPIWPGTGTLPRPRPRFVRNRGLSPVLSPVPVPDLAGTGTLPRPFPSGGPRPGTSALQVDSLWIRWFRRQRLHAHAPEACTCPVSNGHAFPSHWCLGIVRHLEGCVVSQWAGSGSMD